MTAIFVESENLSDAERVIGSPFTVPLSADGSEPASHWGCNWENCPATVLEALAGVIGCTIAESWPAGLEVTGLAVIRARPDEL